MSWKRKFGRDEEEPKVVGQKACKLKKKKRPPSVSVSVESEDVRPFPLDNSGSENERRVVEPIGERPCTDIEARNGLESERQSGITAESNEGTPDQVEQELVSQGLANSWTPQEILKGLEVVNEVEEEEAENEDRKNEREQLDKGKQRVSTEMRLMDVLRDALEPEATPATETGNDRPFSEKVETTPATAPERHPTRNKLSKRPSHRVSHHKRKPSSSKPKPRDVKIQLKKASIVSLQPRARPRQSCRLSNLGFYVHARLWRLCLE